MTAPSGIGDALGVKADGTKQILPDAEGVFDAIGRIGYEFEQAVADLLDNSIDAFDSVSPPLLLCSASKSR